MARVSDSAGPYSVTTVIPVWWGDQDKFGHVNNTVYFRWFESARIEYTTRIGLQDWLEREQIGPILAAVACNFRKQLTYPDVVHVGTRVSKIGRTSMTIDHSVFSTRLNALAADGSSTVVLFDYKQNRPVPIPESLVETIERLENRSLRPAREPE